MSFAYLVGAVIIAALISVLLEKNVKNSALVYDIETIEDEILKEPLIVLICFYDYFTGTYGYCLFDRARGKKGSYQKFRALVKKRREIIGFNSLQHDDRICETHGITVKTTFDIYERVREAAKRQARHNTIKGYNLDNLSKANFGEGKLKHPKGWNVPRMWHEGDLVALVAYCMKDVELTKNLYDNRRKIKDPNSSLYLNLER